MTWLRDYNWPVAHVLAPFLATIGSPVIPEVHRVLQTNDDVWKYWVLMCIVAESHEVAEALQEELTRLAESPTSGEVAEEVNVVAQEILHRLKGNEGASL